MKTSRESLWAVGPEDRPREKLKRLGPAGLTDSELVALVLGSGTSGVNVLDSAQRLLHQTGGVQELMGLTVGELTSLSGVGVATAGRVVAVSELWRRAHDPDPGVLLEHPHNIVDAVRAFLAARTRQPNPPTDSELADSEPSHVEQSDTEMSDAEPSDTEPSDTERSRDLTVLVIADDQLHLRVIMPLATEGRHDEAGLSAEPESIQSLVSRVLHEVLYRGGAAFAVVHVMTEIPADDSALCATRDVLRLASATVGLRFLSAIVIAPTEWAMLE